MAHKYRIWNTGGVVREGTCEDMTFGGLGPGEWVEWMRGDGDEYNDPTGRAEIPTSADSAPVSEYPNILREAEAAVYGDRERDYGHPRDDLRRTAVMWRAWLLARYGTDLSLDALDVSKMMRDVKDARLINGSLHRDSHVDIAGWAAAGARALGVDE